MANRIVMADVAWRDCHVVPVRLSIAQEQMVTQSQYLIEAEELQHAFLPASIEYQITASSSPGLLRVGPSALAIVSTIAPACRFSSRGDHSRRKGGAFCCVCLLCFSPGVNVVGVGMLGAGIAL